MNTILPLRETHNEDKHTVGVKAKLLSSIEKTIPVPFSLVITTKIWDIFIKTNNLENDIETIIANKDATKEKQINTFLAISKKIQTATFPQTILDELRECFELIILDQDSLHIDGSRKKTTIISLQRSTTYDDGDTICHGKLFTADKFDEFIRLIKSIYLSTCSPSSIEYREDKGITSFKTAIIISKMPKVTTCFESFLQQNTNTISVNTYKGFPDCSAIVNRDKFLLHHDFLRIVKNNIQTQNSVCVFDIHTNRILIRDFETTSSQSATEQQVLEAGRLTKKIISILGTEKCFAEFILDNQNTMYCTNVFLENMKHTTQTKTNITEIIQTHIQKNSEEKKEPEPENTRLEIEIDDETTSEHNKEFINAMREFLENHRHSEYHTSIEVILRALQNEPSKEAVLQGIQIIKEIILQWN